MAKKKTDDTEHKITSSLSACFGFCGTNYMAKTKSKTKPERKSSPGWFSRLTKSRLTRSTSGSKTVPVEADLNPIKHIRAQVIKSRSSKSNLSAKPLSEITKLEDTNRMPSEPVDQSAIEKSPEHGREQKNTPGNKNKKHIDSVKNEKRSSHGWKEEATGSPTIIKPTAITISHSGSLASWKQYNKLLLPAPVQQNEEINAGKFDPLVGMSVIMVTLVIMIFWGRLCAILSTCSWLYFIPCFRASLVKSRDKANEHMDMDCQKYKRRVVLEGFLERNSPISLRKP